MSWVLNVAHVTTTPGTDRLSRDSSLGELEGIRFAPLVFVCLGELVAAEWAGHRP